MARRCRGAGARRHVGGRYGVASMLLPAADHVDMEVAPPLPWSASRSAPSDVRGARTARRGNTVGSDFQGRTTTYEATSGA